MEVGVELHSTSKNFNMTGWRCGFVAGNERLVKAYGAVKDNTDSGQFLAIQNASAYAFDHPEITAQIAAKYSRRMDGLVPLLNRLGFQRRETEAGASSCTCPRPGRRSMRTARKRLSGRRKRSANG